MAKTETSGLRGGPAVTVVPDRRRIDSDVRAFLREPSTPWIVFDREGRPPSQLAVGELLPSAFSSVSDGQRFFPATAAIDGIASHASHASQTRVEPSSLAVASDLNGVEGDSPAEPLSCEGASPILVSGLTRRVIGAAAAAVAIASTLALGAFAIRAASQSMVSSPSVMTQALAGHGSPVPADLAPPNLDPTPPAAPPVVAEQSAPPALTPPVVSLTPPVVSLTPPSAAGPESPAKAAAKKYARLTVAGEARSRDVFMDGKRMLGKGARSFTVLCGTHTVAIGERSNTREVEIPCTGTAELVISN